MAKLSHKQKVRIGRHMLSQNELINGMPIFISAGWYRRKQAIAARVKKQQTIAHYHAEQRRAQNARQKAAS